MFFDSYYLVYLVSGLIMIPCLLLSLWASAKVRSAYAKYDKMPNSTNWTGSDCARMLLERGGSAVQVVPGKGHLTDNFNPRTQTVTLSQSVYGSASVAAVAVAAHEAGHVMQREEGWLPYRLRAVLVPVTNIGTYLAFPLVIVGIVLTWALTYTEVGNAVVFVAICLYALSTVFSLVTLPVELNASSRARKMLADTGVLVTDEEKKAAKKVLSAAAMTYVAALLTSLLYFFRFVLYALAMSRRKN